MEYKGIIELLKSNDHINHELALTMFIGLGGNVDEFVKLYIDEVAMFNNEFATTPYEKLHASFFNLNYHIEPGGRRIKNELFIYTPTISKWFTDKYQIIGILYDAIPDEFITTKT